MIETAEGQYIHPSPEYVQFEKNCNLLDQLLLATVSPKHKYNDFTKLAVHTNRIIALHRYFSEYLKQQLGISEGWTLVHRQFIQDLLPNSPDGDMKVILDDFESDYVLAVKTPEMAYRHGSSFHVLHLDGLAQEIECGLENW